MSGTAGCRACEKRRCWRRSRATRRRTSATSPSGRRRSRGGRGLGVAVGLGRPGWHIECSAMAEKFLGTEFEPTEGERPPLPAPRERARPVVQPRSPVREGLDAQRDAPTRRGEDVQVTRQCRDASQRARHVGSRDAARLPSDGHWRKPVDFDDEVLAQAAAQAESFRNVFRGPSEAAPSAAWDRFAAALEDDFNTPDALAVMHEWRDYDLLRRALGVFGLASLADEVLPADVVTLAEERRRTPARQVTMPPPTHCVTGSPPPAGTCATLPASRGSSSFRARDARPRLRAECRPGGVARPARRARVVGDRARLCDARLAVGGPPRADPPRAGARRQPARPTIRGRRLVRALPLRRRLGPLPRADSHAHLPRPGHRSSQPRRRRARGRRRRGERGGRPRARFGARHAGGVPGVGGRRRASPGRRGAEPRPLRLRGEGAGAGHTPQPRTARRRSGRPT